MTYGVNSSTTWNAQPSWLQKVSTQTVAKGYTGCAQGTVSFDMGTAKSWLSGSPQWTIGLRADNEGDPLGWKRFDNNPSMRVTYDTPPNTPTIWGITGGLWNGSTYVTRYEAPTYYVKASDPDGINGGNISVLFTVKTATGQVLFTGSSLSGSPAAGTMFNWASGILNGDKAKGNTNYILTAQAKDQQGQLSGVMSFSFTVDTTPPPAPVVTAVSVALNNPTHTDAAGTVGATQYTLSLSKGAATSSKPSYDVKGFVYAVTDGPAESTYPADLKCTNPRVGSYVMVCGPSTSTSINVAAIGQPTTLTAWAFDTAGNVNTQVAGAPVSYSFSVGNAGTLPSTTLPVTLYGGASWVNIDLVNGYPSVNNCAGTVPDDPGNPDVGKALQLTGSGDYAATSGSAVDTAHSFTVGGWFCSLIPTKATVQSLITQMAGAGSPGAALQINTTGYAELAQYTAPSSGGREAATAKDPLSANGHPGWFYVVGVSDQVNQQLRITVTGGQYTGTWTVATASSVHLSSPQAQPVLLGAAGPGGAGQFTGQIFQPMMVSGVLTKLQINNGLMSQNNPDLGVQK